jgi:hypothetical protein
MPRITARTTASALVGDSRPAGRTGDWCGVRRGGLCLSEMPAIQWLYLADLHQRSKATLAGRTARSAPQTVGDLQAG